MTNAIGIVKFNQNKCTEFQYAINNPSGLLTSSEPQTTTKHGDHCTINPMHGINQLSSFRTSLEPPCNTAGTRDATTVMHSTNSRTIQRGACVVTHVRSRSDRRRGAPLLFIRAIRYHRSRSPHFRRMPGWATATLSDELSFHLGGNARCAAS